jgi:hypothetical protein
MIYCVNPGALADEPHGPLTDYYRDEPNVEVIVDRREGPDRRQGQGAGHYERRETRDRRRRGIAGTFPSIEVPE